jgi:hypothetical protein
VVLTWSWAGHQTEATALVMTEKTHTNQGDVATLFDFYKIADFHDDDFLVVCGTLSLYHTSLLSTSFIIYSSCRVTTIIAPPAKSQSEANRDAPIILIIFLLLV